VDISANRSGFGDFVVIEAFEILIAAAAIYFVIDQIIEWHHH